MNRTEKITLLKKIVTGKASDENLSQLRQSNGPGAIVITYQPGTAKPGPNDEVTFHYEGKKVTMPYKNIQAFTHYEPLTICMMPDNGRRKVPDSK
ncbi:hypothetical protein [Spirosoma pulveris]